MNTTGLDHIVLTVSNVEQSRRFYADVLGFDVHTLPTDFPNAVFAGAAFFMVGSVEIFLVTHPQAAGDRFSEQRIGLDHLSFKAPDEAALHALVTKLRAAGIATNGVEAFGPGSWPYVSFRDPDNIQLEYWLSR